jgi:HAD superfamily hydrolase (TIGR01509 family)
LDRLDHRLDEQRLIAAWSLAFAPNVELLGVFHRHRLPVCVFTNNGPMLDLCLAGPLASIARAVNEVVCSWKAGAKKPDPVAFAYVAELLGEPTEDLYLIDDDIRNVHTAISLGWVAHHFTTIDSLSSVLADLQR